jgi:long-chain acyl-CoA synthetase
MTELSLGEVFAARARDLGASTALIADGVDVSFAELDDRAGRLAGALLAASVGTGSRVGYLGRNSSEYVVSLAACGKLGAVMVPLNWRLAHAELVAILADAQAVLVIVDDEFTAAAETLRADRGVAADVRLVDTRSPAGPRWYDGHAPHLPTSVPPAEAVALQLYTSGTTGRPKGVLSSHVSVIESLRLLSRVAGIQPSSVSLCTLPTFHIGGTSWTLAGIFAGCPTVLLRETDAEAVLDTVAAQHVTTMIAVPAVIQLLVEALHDGDTRGKTLERLYYGGGPMTGPVLERALAAFGCEFVQGFGMTELPLMLALTPDLHVPGSPLLLSCGQLVPETEARIVDPATEAEVGPGSVGELWVRSSRTMLGYWNQPDETAKALLPGGWLRTGDAMHVDDDGFYFLHDRIKDVIISGGENIYSAEVENVLMAHPAILECAVIGVPSARWTETVKAVVVLRAGHSAADGELICFCRERLAGYKCPTSVEVVAALPRTPSGKVRKADLRKPYWPATR